MVWLIVFLLVGPPALLSKGAARLPSFLGAAARWWHSREPREHASGSYRVSQSEIARITADYERLNRAYGDLVAHNVEQDKRMDNLEAELTEEKRRFWSAIGYIRQLIDSLHRHAPEADIPDPPEMLRNIV